MNLNFIKKCSLFAGIEETELETLLRCLSASVKTYGKDEFIFMAEDRALFVGLVLSGGARVLQEDFWGNRSILAHIGPGGLFGEAFACAGLERLPVSVVSSTASEIMTIDYRKTITTCTSACAFHTRLVMNMLKTLAEKNLHLTRKMEHLSKRTIREKLLSFLSMEAARAGSAKVEIPFNRQELSEYLCSDRSALSRELSAMQREGLIEYDKNQFALKRGE